MGVPRFSERVRDFRRGPAGAGAVGFAPAVLAAALVGASSRAERTVVSTAGLAGCAGFR